MKSLSSTLPKSISVFFLVSMDQICFQVEANCDNGIEWYGSYKECAVAVLNATKKEDQEWFCELEEDRFIVQQNEPIGTAKSQNLTLTINEHQ